MWVAKASLIVPNSTSDLSADLGTLGTLESGGAIFSQQLNTLKILNSILLSEDILRQVWNADPERAQYSLENFSGLFKVSPESETTVLALSAEGSSAALVQQRLRRLIQVFQAHLDKLRIDDAAGKSRFMQRELSQAKQALQKAQVDLAQFQSTTNLVDGNTQTQELVKAINAQTTAHAQVLAEYRASEAQAQRLSQKLELSSDQAIRSLRLGENQSYQAAQQKLAELNGKLAEAQGLYTAESPQIQTLYEQRREMIQQIDTLIAGAKTQGIESKTVDGESSGALTQQLILVESQSMALRQQANQLQQHLNQLNQTLRSLPKTKAQLLQLQRHYDIAEGIHRGLMAKVKESKLNAFSAYPNVQVLAQPSFEPKPIGKTKLILLGGLLASGFGSAALLLFLERRNPLLRLEDLQALDLPLLGAVPPLKLATITQQPTKPIAFQRLASAISMIPLVHRRLLITSATAGEGKTTLLLGLANALTSLGFRVLMVDGDLRRAALSQRLGYQDLRHHEGNHPLIAVRPRLALLPTSSLGDHAAAFVAQGGFEQWLAEAEVEAEYDYILVDSAPVNLVSETVLMSQATDSVLVVAKLGKSKRSEFNLSLDQLTRCQTKVLGLVANGVETPDESYLYGLKERKVQPDDAAAKTKVTEAAV
jgi:Mrp family chromosome partitioning ATPase